jgi:hypothetical protein
MLVYWVEIVRSELTSATSVDSVLGRASIAAPATATTIASEKRMIRQTTAYVRSD